MAGGRNGRRGPHSCPPWLDGTRELGRAQLSRATLCPSLRPLLWAGDTDHQESASLLALVMSLLQGLSGTSRPTDPHAHPHPHWRSSQSPGASGLFWLLVVCFGSLKPVNSGATQENPTPSEPGPPSEVTIGPGPGDRPCRKSHTSSRSLSWEQMAKVNVALGTASPGAPPRPWAPLWGAWLSFLGLCAGKRCLLSQHRARVVSPSWRDVGEEMPTACLQMPEPPPPLMTFDTPGVRGGLASGSRDFLICHNK